MRMRARLRDERGATAIMLIFILIVLMALLAVVIDGGLLLSKYRRVRRASDAAAIAAAISCRDGDGLAASQAGTYASENLVDPSGPETPSVTVTFEDLQGNRKANCLTIRSGGKVTVRVSAPQSLMFAPAVSRLLNPAVDESSIRQPKQVVATATAVWGGAGVGQGVVPMMLSSNRLSTCNIPFGVSDGDVCAFWFNNGNKASQTNQDLMNAEWGWIDLGHWNVGRYGACPGNANPKDIGAALTTPVESMSMATPPPTYSCRGNGNMTSLFNSNGNGNGSIDDVLGETVVYPVNDPTQQVAANGTVCPPNSLTNCTVIKYAIVGFAELELMNVYKGNTSEAAKYCKRPSDANARCLVAVWHGFDTSGFFGGGGQNFGVTAVGLTK